MNRSKIELTNLEKIVKEGLDKLNIEYIEQYSTRTGFVLDFLIFDNIDLEVDGIFHDTAQARKRDSFRTYMLKREGYKVIRIHHSELKNNNIKDILKEKLGI